MLQDSSAESFELKDEIKNLIEMKEKAEEQLWLTHEKLFRIECDGVPVESLAKDEVVNPDCKIYEAKECGSEIVDILQEEAENQEWANIPWTDHKYPL